MFPFIGNLFPSTDFSKVNLDWIFEVIENCQKTIREVADEISSMVASASNSATAAANSASAAQAAANAASNIINRFGIQQYSQNFQYPTDEEGSKVYKVTIETWSSWPFDCKYIGLAYIELGKYRDSDGTLINTSNLNISNIICVPRANGNLNTATLYFTPKIYREGERYNVKVGFSYIPKT